MAAPSLGAAFAFAYAGILRTLTGERNMKVHWVSGTAVMMVGMALPLSVSSRAALLFAVVLVIATEVLNGAIEGVVDLATRTWAYEAKLAKDAAAGTVLLVAVGAVLVLADVLSHQWALVEASGPAVRRTLLFGLPSLAGLGVGLTASPRGLAVFGFVVAGATFLPLAWASEDLVFTLAGAASLVVAADARRRRAELLNRNPT